ncbi:Lon protease C-terminal proteolytic domain-containing protein [Pilobolus umbonatus]|nr:Lon protease C-terminal proteolytic domain-containing protein [Pilobolus umbonatus]
MIDITSLPSCLPILPLVNQVLLPSISSKYVLTQEDFRKILRFSPSYIVCIPFESNESDQQAVDDDRAEAIVITVKGICRSRVKDIYSSDGGHSLQADLEHYAEETHTCSADDHIVRDFQSLCQRFITDMRCAGVSAAVLNQIYELNNQWHSSYMANFLLCISESSFCDKLRALELVNYQERLQEISETITRYLQTIRECSTKNESELLFDQIRRRFYLNQEFTCLEPPVNVPTGTRKRFRELAEDDEELVDLIRKLNEANLPDNAVISVQRDLNRMRKLPVSSADSHLLRTYIEYVAELPWHTKETESNINISMAKQQLDKDHFGIEHVKKRILEYLSVIKVNRHAKAPILCLIGPPGVGKTTLAKSIATALNRKFHRISLGGVRDEAEIRGHRRTYVGALPGLLLHGMRECGVQNPVILLDEIDKMSKGSNQGDPASAMLEVLDPAQNCTFVDHFLNIPYDLSKVTFIATANTSDSIPSPLLDRMEMIQLNGYTFDEKLYIAQTHLIPKQLETHGLAGLGVEIPDDVVLRIAERYTRESGVRNLERLVASLCRYKCHEYANLDESGQLDQFEPSLGLEKIEDILGTEPFENETVENDDIAGVVTGLAYSNSGNGGILLIETSYMPGESRLKLTGSLGDVIKESAQIAISWVKTNAYFLKLTASRNEDIFKNIDIHIHLPSGAVRKDGPSAGIAMVVGLISLLSGNNVPRTTAMTGEITLRGQIRPVGGIKEKVISAHRAGIKKILLPFANRRDINKDVSDKIKKEITFVYCKSIWEAVETAFEHSCIRYESRMNSSL